MAIVSLSDRKANLKGDKSIADLVHEKGVKYYSLSSAVSLLPKVYLLPGGRGNFARWPGVRAEVASRGAGEGRASASASAGVVGPAVGPI